MKQTEYAFSIPGNTIVICGISTTLKCVFFWHWVAHMNISLFISQCQYPMNSGNISPIQPSQLYPKYIPDPQSLTILNPSNRLGGPTNNQLLQRKRWPPNVKRRRASARAGSSRIIWSEMSGKFILKMEVLMGKIIVN